MRTTIAYVMTLLLCLQLSLFGATVTTSYGANTAFTIAFTGLANGSSVQSSYVDVTTAGAGSTSCLDLSIVVKVRTNTAGTSSTGYVTVSAYGGNATTEFSGSDGAAGITGTAGSVTINNPSNLKLLGVINANANAVNASNTGTFEGMFMLSNAFGQVLPHYVGIVITNSTGATLDASTGTASYACVSLTVAQAIQNYTDRMLAHTGVNV
jgi:hypothetical protein